MADFDILARIRKLEAENDKLKHRVAELERAAEAAKVVDATAYGDRVIAGNGVIWPLPHVIR